MKPIYEMGTIHVEVTNACNMVCANCTRFIGHHKNPFFMNLASIIKAIESLEGYPGKIGLMGGEPTLHPRFKEICNIFQKKIPNKKKRAFWTNGFKWKEYEKIIRDTFDSFNTVYNDHNDPKEGIHQPLLIAAKDVIEDEELMWKLIDDCWIQRRWSASMTPKGGFFCEVAAAQDHLFNGPGGYPLEKGWWHKTPAEFHDQIERYCPNCSAAIPMPRPSSHSEKDVISKSIAKKLEEVKSPRFLQGKVKIFEKKLTKEEIKKHAEDWTPWSHRSYKQFTPDLIIYER